MSESKDPETVLREIHSMVSELQDNQSNDFPTDGPRMTTKSDTKRGKALKYISDNQPILATEIKDDFDATQMSCLSRLHDAFLIDREKERNGGSFVYRYTTTPWGEGAIESWENPSEGNTDSLNPWERADVKEATWVVLDLIDTYDGHPKSSDINDDFIEAGFGATNESLRVSPELSGLYKDGYVDRPTSRPYRYWLTDKGREVLTNGRE